MNLTKRELREVTEAYGNDVAKLVLAALLETRRALSKATDYISSPAHARQYLTLRLSHLEYEAFWVVWLDAQNRVMGEPEEMFRGTLTQTSVYPREIAKRALQVNAAGVFLCHNHPSGSPEASFQDQALTRTMSQALALLDVKVLDHFIIAAGKSLSFAERGLLPARVVE
jgi:DNA repair protein RadC